MAMRNWPHAIWRFYRSRIICSTQPTTVPWHSLAVCVCFTCVTDVCIRSVCSNILCYSQGLAMESLEANKLLWKSRPKHHKLLGSKVAMMIHNTSPVKYDLSRFLLLYDHFLSKARPSGLRCWPAAPKTWANMFLVDTHLTYASVGWGEWNDSWTFTSKKNGNTNETAEHGDPQPTTFPSQPLGTWWAPMWKRQSRRRGHGGESGWVWVDGESMGTTRSMGTTKFVIYYLCYTYNVVFCFDWVKGCRGDIPLENLDFGIIAPPVGTPWYIYI